MQAKIEFVSGFWQLTLPCGHSIEVSGLYAEVPQVCPVCKKTFVHLSARRVAIQSEPARVRC